MAIAPAARFIPLAQAQDTPAMESLATPSSTTTIDALQARHSATQPDATPTYLSQWLERPSLQFGRMTIASETYRNFYSTRAFQPVWIDADGLNDRGKAALSRIASVGEHGLNPNLYGVDVIHTVNAMPRDNAEETQRIRLSLELLISNAVVHYATDMQGGNAPHQWDTGRQPITAAEQLAILQQAASAPDETAYLAQLAPQSKAYIALQNALHHYQSIAANGGWPSFPKGKPIKPGTEDARIPTLRQILTATGDLPATSVPPTQPNQYDAALVAATKRFQERHSIDANGTISPATQDALDVPVTERIHQMSMTLERMRWMPHDLGSRYVLVNVPGYKLTAVSGTKTMQMDVIVGSPRTPTPLFSHQITDVIFNPEWGVPQKIAMHELLPKIRKNPDYLVHAGYTVVAHSGGSSYEVDPAAIDWEAVGDGSNYSFRQNAGAGNALGKVKFNIPDSDDIYLHGTSQPALFAKSERSLSHGCIRLSDPLGMAEFVLTDAGWKDDKIDATYDSSASRTVHITPLPVHLVYWTSWVDDAGREHFQRDIYGMDKILLAEMQAPRSHETIKLASN